MISTQDIVGSRSAATDVAVAQLVALAQRANVTFEVLDGRLAMRAARFDAKLWPPIRKCLDELGTATIIDYFKRTPPERRATLSAAA